MPRVVQLSLNSPASEEPIGEDADHFDVGSRLRLVREKQGLSQRELARRAGVTNGTISLIEQNKNSPSVASLRKVLQGIPMSLAEFFSGDDLPASSQQFFRAKELVEIGRSGVSFSQCATTVMLWAP